MGKLLTIMRSAPKRSSALVAMIAAAVVVPAALFAWGPDRPTFTVENPADHITFNAITNNPDYGDERNFVRIKDASDMSAGNWKDELTVQPGKEYLVQMYVHNNAASSLNLVAQNTRVMANVPNTTGKKVQIDGFITADNATPNRVWDQAIFNSDRNFNLTYVNGSTKFYNNVFGQAGTTLSDSIVTDKGAQVGYDKIDGKVPGCFQFSGYVSFKVKAQVAQTANHTVTKEVSKHGANKWSENYTAKPGEVVDYLIEYKNIGEAQTDNVMISDVLPAGASYVNGSTVLGNALHPAGLKASDNITKNGINIGSYKQNGGAWIIFSAKVAENDKLPVCGKNTLINKARATTDFGWKEDTANVTVDKTCVKPKDIKVCDLASKKIITIREDQFDANKHSKNLKDCEVKPGKITVCELATKKIITIDENKFDASKHSKNMKDCETTPVIPVTPAELPKTGAGDGVAAALALGALVASASYYIASRRLLGN
jgi:uncharacterized repeat protein (TIGR01451 family)/LPXTG-motif cell wall-anchored protein